MSVKRTYRRVLTAEGTLKLFIQLELHFGRIHTHPRQRVIRHALLKEIVLALHRDPLHPGKRIRRGPQLVVAQCRKKPICHELNVFAHARRRHADQRTRQRLRDKLLFDLDRLLYQLVRLRLGQPVFALRIQQTSKVRVQPLIPRNKLVRGRETR